MNQIKNLQKLAELSYFDKPTLAQFVTVSDNALSADIKRWLKSGRLIQLKRGLYVTREYLLSRPDKEAYGEFVAGKLYEPSYLSLEYVLQKFGILSEAVSALTSITLKATRLFSNDLGVFSYRRMKRELFCGYEIESRAGFAVKIAGKAKALFDMLYLKVLRLSAPDQTWFGSLRLNLDGFSNADLREFSCYCEMSGIPKILTLPKLVRRFK